MREVGRERSVDDAMIRTPKTWGADLTLAEAAELLAGSHLHAVLVVDGARLRGVVVETDLTSDDDDGAPALSRARLAGRTVTSGAPLAEAEELLRDSGLRRLAVVDDAGDLVGLLCLKRRRDGFCTEEGVEARRRERASGRVGEPVTVGPDDGLHAVAGADLGHRAPEV